MQTTEKLNLPFQQEINLLAEIQVQQSEYFTLSIEKQFDFFSQEYNATRNHYYNTDQLDLVKKLELVDFLFDLNLEPQDLPKEFIQTFSLLKIITAKSALYHSAFFSHTHNPFAHYLRTASEHIKSKLHDKNKSECLTLLSKNIQTLIVKYQSDPSMLDDETKSIINIFKTTKALNNAKQKETPTLKTSSLKDRFSHSVSHSKEGLEKQNKLFILSAKNLKKGDWINFTVQNSTQLIKLIWKADDDSEFIFVNKEGVKVLQCNLSELAEDLENGIVSVMSNSSQVVNKTNSFLKTIG